MVALVFHKTHTITCLVSSAHSICTYVTKHIYYSDTQQCQSHTHTHCDIESEYIPTTFTATVAATVDSSFIKIHNDWPRCEASSRDDY